MEFSWEPTPQISPLAPLQNTKRCSLRWAVRCTWVLPRPAHPERRSGPTAEHWWGEKPAVAGCLDCLKNAQHTQRLELENLTAQTFVEKKDLSIFMWSLNNLIRLTPLTHYLVGLVERPGRTQAPPVQRGRLRFPASISFLFSPWVHCPTPAWKWKGQVDHTRWEKKKKKNYVEYEDYLKFTLTVNWRYG